MTPTMDAERWIHILDESYLGDYLPAGGSSVKFAVCYPGADVHSLSERLAAKAARRGLLAAAVASNQVKIHLIEKLFGAIADQIPWDELTTNVLADLARQQNWLVPASLDPNRGLVDQLDQHNDLGRQQISLVLQRECGRQILQDRALAKDFRLAMMWLARDRLEQAAGSGIATRQIADWLGGRVVAISNMKPYQIHTKITRANARHLFGSLLSWIRKAGHPGLVVMLDAGRVVESVRAEDGGLHYTTAAVLDAYEVLRQFIDATDELDGLLLLTLMPPAFLDLDLRGRGVARYQALMARVYDDVRATRHPNPFSALIRLGNAGEAA